LSDFLELIMMVKETRSKRGRRGSVMIFLTLALPFFVGLVGLGIDATMCYIVQTELSAAVDGAALGTGRLLSTNANSTDIANEFLNANFRTGQAGFWGSYGLTPTVTVTTGITKTVTVNAVVTVPLLFMRLLHENSATLTATATATRRDARIEFVIDRSGSMNAADGAGSTVIADLVTYAKGFTEQFTAGYDELGLVVFSGSAVVGYPITPWPSGVSPTGSGGPDTSFYSSSTGGAAHDMVYQIGQISAASGTAMGEGLALAYIELQKAHMRDMAADGNIDTRLNAIVLFTDGVPSSVATYLNRNTNHVVAAGSNCKYLQDAATPTNPMYGYVVQGSNTGNPPYSASWGFYQLGSIDSNAAHTSTWYMQNPTGDYVSPSPNTPETNCSSGGWNPLDNLSAIPSFDKYGYSLSPNGNGYKLSSFVGNPDGATSIYTGTAFSTTSGTSAYQWGLAAWDEVDQVAQAIRSDANYANRTGDTSPMVITIFTLGYTGDGGTDNGLLTKIANPQGCTVGTYNCYVNTEPAGLYAQASNPTALANALSIILTAILRLAR